MASRRMSAVCIVLVTTVVVVIWLSVLVLIVRVRVALLMLAVALIVMALLWVSRHDRDLEIPPANGISAAVINLFSVVDDMLSWWSAFVAGGTTTPCLFRKRGEMKLEDQANSQLCAHWKSE